MRNFILGILFAVTVGGLYLSNPSKDAFSLQYADKVNEDVAKDLGLTNIGGPIGDFLGGLSQNVIQEAIKSQVKEQDYLLASVFTLPTSGEDIRVLGIAGQYIPLN